MAKLQYGSLELHADLYVGMLKRISQGLGTKLQAENLSAAEKTNYFHNTENFGFMEGSSQSMKFFDGKIIHMLLCTGLKKSIQVEARGKDVPSSLK